MSAELRSAVREALGACAPEPAEAAWRAVAAQGWCGLGLPAAVGGMGLGSTAAVVAAEEFGRVLFRDLYLDTAFAAHLVLLAGEPQHRDILPGIAAGRVRIATGSGAVLDAAGRTLTGGCAFAGPVPRATHLLVNAGGTLVLLSLPRPGVVADERKGLADPPLYRIGFDGVAVHPDEVLGDPGAAEPAWSVALAGARLRLAGYLVGLCDAVLERTTRAALDRHQFGGPVAGFQSVAFGLAALAARIEAGRALVDDVARRADRGEDIRPAAARALDVTGRLALDVTAQGLHFHGARGLLRRTGVERYHREAAVAVGLLGPPAALGAEVWDHLRRPAPAPAPAPGAAGTEPAPRFDLPADLTLHGLVEAQARRTPDAVAVVADGTDLTYAALDRRADEVAAGLRRLGVGAEVVVGVALDRSPELVVALLAVLKAGGAYLPLDPEHPADRLRLLVADARVGMVLTAKRVAAGLPAFDVPVHLVDRLAGPRPDSPAADGPAADGAAASGPRADGLAYVMYTSGSTGRPKGVMVTHRGICNRLLWERLTYPLGPADAVVQHTSIGFDISVLEIFGPLVQGARVVLARPGGQRDPAYLIGLMSDHDVTVLALVPSALRVLLDERPGLESCRSLRYVFSGGEPLTPALRDRFFRQMNAELHNFYGPTEASVDATFWDCAESAWLDTVPIGRPLAGVRVYVLDPNLRPVPVGVDGELFVGGPGVARGYLHRPDLTADRFLPDPFAPGPGERMYRTGDRGRRLASGAVEFRGRLDEQVKVRGFRVEPGEIEAVLCRHEGVRDAAVVAAAGGGQLVAHLVPAGAAAPTAEAVRAFLAAALPPYMVPGHVIVRDALPRLPTGKVDRTALRRESGAPDSGPREVTRSAAADGPVADRLAALFARVLARPGVGTDDSFFALGGDSLQAVRLVALARRELGLPASLQTLFDAPTPAAWARAMDGGPAG